MKTQNKNLSKRQIHVLNDFFSGNLDQDAVLARHNLSRNVFRKWMTNKKFAQAFSEQSNIAFKQSEMILARYAPLAAARLVELASKGNGETARKACLDIISTHSYFTQQQSAVEQSTDTDSLPELSDETASKLLAVLAQQEIPKA